MVPQWAETAAKSDISGWIITGIICICIFRVWIKDKLFKLFKWK